MKPPRILLTNDDGILSPGLKAAAEALAPMGEVIVVAPRVQQSGAGRGMWGGRDERLSPMPFEAAGRRLKAYACACSPAQVVLHGMNVLFGRGAPELLVSGINYGENLGYNVTLSGTIGAALQGASMGAPALAMSVQTVHAFADRYEQVDWSAAQHFTALFARLLLRRRLPHDVHVLNVDVPDGATPRTPWKVTALARQEYFTTRLETPSLDSRLGDGATGVYFDRCGLEGGSDIHAILQERVVSVTPLSLDLTSRVSLEDLRTLLAAGDATDNTEGRG